MNSERAAESASAEQKKKSSYVLDRPEPYDPQEAIRAVELPHHSTLFRIGVWMTVIGYLILILGAKPSFFGLDRNPVIGFEEQTYYTRFDTRIQCADSDSCRLYRHI